VLGLGELTLAEIVAMTNPALADELSMTATLIVTLGLILTGVAVLRAGRWEGRRRFALLVCGLYLPLVVVPAFSLPGYAAHYAIAVWGVSWVLLGLALLEPASTDDLKTMG